MIFNDRFPPNKLTNKHTSVVLERERERAPHRERKGGGGRTNIYIYIYTYIPERKWDKTKERREYRGWTLTCWSISWLHLQVNFAHLRFGHETAHVSFVCRRSESKSWRLLYIHWNIIIIYPLILRDSDHRFYWRKNFPQMQSQRSFCAPHLISMIYGTCTENFLY